MGDSIICYSKCAYYFLYYNEKNIDNKIVILILMSWNKAYDIYELAWSITELTVYKYQSVISVDLLETRGILI